MMHELSVRPDWRRGSLPARSTRAPRLHSGRADLQTSRKSEAGFTLVECLVALAVLAVAAAGLITASEQHVDRVRGLEARAVAQLVAENRIVELGLPGATVDGRGQVAMLGRQWTVETSSKPSSDPEIAAVTVAVSEAAGAGGPLVTMDAFAETRR